MVRPLLQRFPHSHFPLIRIVLGIVVRGTHPQMGFEP